MANENEVLDERDESVGSDGTGSKFGGFLGVLIRILGWGVPILLGVVLMFLTASIVMNNRSSDGGQGDSDIVKPNVFMKPPIYPVQPLDTFTVTLDKTDDNAKTTMVTTELVLAYPPDSNEIASELNERKEQLSDALQSVISRKRYDDINSADERETELKLELIDTVNRNLINKGIVDIFITKFEISRF